MSEIVNPFSIQQEQASKFISILEEAGLNTELMQKVVDSSENKLAEGVVDLIRSQIVSTFPCYRLAVEYGRSVEQLVKDGKYDSVSNSFSDGNFLTNDERCYLDVYLLFFDRVLSSRAAIREIDKLGFRPATIRELLSLGAQYPDLQRNDPIVALGSTSYYRPLGGLGVPCLDVHGWFRPVRELRLVAWDFNWNLRWRFAAVSV